MVKDGQQGDVENRAAYRICLHYFRCGHLPTSTGVKIVSIVSILLGLLFCSLGIWMILVSTHNSALPPRSQLVYEVPLSRPIYEENGLSVFNTALTTKDQDSINLQSSKIDTFSVYITAPSSSQTQNSSRGGTIESFNWPSSSVSGGKGPYGRRPPAVNSTEATIVVALSSYYVWTVGLGVVSICVGVVRILTSGILVWNFVEKHSKTPGAIWVFVNTIGSIGMLACLGLTLYVTGFIYDFPWRRLHMSESVKNDQFCFYLLLTILRILCVFDVILTFYFVLIVICFVKTTIN